MDLLDRFRSSLSLGVSSASPSTAAASTVDVDGIIGNDLLAAYESHQSQMHHHTTLINRSARHTINTAQLACDMALRLGDDWQRLRSELDALPSLLASIESLNTYVADIGAKFDRLEQSLNCVIEAREHHFAEQYQSKKDSQLDRQREMNEKSLTTLRQSLEQQMRVETAVYQSVTQVQPPLLESHPIPKKPAPTLYGSADLGEVSTAKSVKQLQQTTVNIPAIQVKKFTLKREGGGSSIGSSSTSSTALSPRSSETAPTVSTAVAAATTEQSDAITASYTASTDADASSSSEATE